MTTINIISGASALGLALAILYFVLRLLAAPPTRHHPRDSAANHALWTAVIGFFASSTSGLQDLLTLHAPTLVETGPDSRYVQTAADQSAASMALTVGAPGLWLGLVYVLAQFTWPRPTARVRQASLEVRTLRGHLPPILASAFALMSVLALGAVAWAWTSPGVAPVTGRDALDPETGEQVPPSFDAVDGLRPGAEAAPWLLAGLLLVVAATWLAALVIIRRRPLSGLTADENNTIRLIGLNRLLRTGILVAGGFLLTAAGSAITAVQFAALPLEELRQRSGLRVGSASSGADLPWGWLVTVLALGSFVVLVAMAAAAPPKLINPDDPRARSTQAHLSGTLVSARLLLNRCHGWALAVALTPLIALLLTLYQALGASSRWPTPSFQGLEAPLVAASLPFACYFLAMLGTEALLRRGHCPPSSPRTAGGASTPPPVAKYALCAAGGVYAVVLALSLATPEGDPSLVVSITTGLLVAAVPAVGWWVLVGRRPDLGRATPAQDARMRALSRHRILRLSAAALFMGAGLIILMDSSLWLHWTGGGRTPPASGGWSTLRWLCADALLALSLLAAFLPSAEFSRHAPTVGPPARLPDGTAEDRTGSGSRA